MEGRGCRGLRSDPDDVICLPKRHASDSECSQPPVLILPQMFMSRLQGKLPETARCCVRAAKERRLMWIELAEALLKQSAVVTPKVARTARYLLKVGRAETPAILTLEPLPWHEQDKSTMQANMACLQATAKLLLPVATFKANLRA